jgi:hypothetical protein
MLRSADWYLVTEVSEQRIGPFLKVEDHENGNNNYQSTRHNFPDERRSHARFAGRLNTQFLLLAKDKN